MKKYLLIKWYPGLPEAWKKEGPIILERESESYYRPVGSTSGWIDSQQVENNPLYWEEAKESNYTILSFKNNDTIVYLHSNGYYSWQDSTSEKVTLLHMLSLKGPTIHSIKDNKTGNIYTIGDSSYYGTITKFSIEDDTIIIDFLTTCSKKLSQLSEKKIDFLFTTADNVNIYRGDTYFYVSSVGVLQILTYLEKPEIFNDGNSCKRFSTKDKAQTYFNNNRIILFTTEDGVNIYYNDKCSWVNITYPNHSMFDGFASGEEPSDYSHTEFKYFSTRKAAQKYKDSRKPLFITEEGKTIFDGDNYFFIHNFIIHPEVATKGIYLPMKNYYYATEKAAKDYILHNKPLFSLDEIIDDQTLERIYLNNFSKEKFTRLAHNKLNK